MALSRHPSLSPTPSYDLHSRKRPSVAQIQRLQAIFESSRYINKEERSALAHEIGLDAKFITVWFQNRRQSDKRKAWTKRDRARKKENTCHRIHIHTVFSKPVVSLDQIASRLERVQSPALPDTPRAVLSTQKPGNSLEPVTPTRSKPEALWAHMPSSPPDAPSSPPRMTTPRLIKSGKSLEWACAKERMGNKYRLKRDKGTRVQRASARRPSTAVKKEQEFDSDSDQDSEASTPAQSQVTNNCSTPKSRPDDLRGKSTKDVEAAMALLQFLRG
ncbi:homeobox domain-containing protein [Lactarius sanguifluus]|nr:homeobox domain-containing protein [Lactarius sanguifluus]